MIAISTVATNLLLRAVRWCQVLSTRSRNRRSLPTLTFISWSWPVTTAVTFGVVEVLLEGNDVFDLMVTAQSSDEIVQFGVPQLARSVDAELPILVLEFDTANSPVVVDLVNSGLSRWPLRDRSSRAVH